MRRAIIVHNCDNDSLLRLTQTKLFYDAKNEGLEYFSDCITVKNYNEAYKIAKAIKISPTVILKTSVDHTSVKRDKKSSRLFIKYLFIHALCKAQHNSFTRKTQEKSGIANKIIQKFVIIFHKKIAHHIRV